MQFTTATDDQLFTAYRDGSSDAFAELYRRHASEVYQNVNRVTRDPHLTDDVVQDAFSRIHTHSGTYRIGSNFRDWLDRIAHNCALQRLRSRKSAAQLNEEVEADLSRPDTVSEGMELEDTRRVVSTTLDGMLPSYAALLRLFFFDGLSYSQIAETHRISVEAARSRVYKALQMFAVHYAGPKNMVSI